MNSIILLNLFSHHYRFTRRDSCQSNGRCSTKWPFQGLHTRRFARTLAGGKCTTNGSITRSSRYGIRIPRYVRIGRMVSQSIWCVKWVINCVDCHLWNQTNKYSRFQSHWRPNMVSMDMTMRKTSCMQYLWLKDHYLQAVSKSNHSIRSICSIYFVGFWKLTADRMKAPMRPACGMYYCVHRLNQQIHTVLDEYRVNCSNLCQSFFIGFIPMSLHVINHDNLFKLSNYNL